MAFWLMKSEPSTYSWDDLVREGRTHWDGVRNYQAANNMKSMKNGDKAFFYHSGKERQIMGTVKIVKEAYLDKSDPTKKFVMVDVETLKSLKKPVSLKSIKESPKLKSMELVVNSRLSVQKVQKSEWIEICKLGNVKP